MSTVFYTAQAQFSGCFNNAGCTGPALGIVSAENCCLNTVGTYFNDGGQCLQCIGRESFVYNYIIATLFLPLFCTGKSAWAKVHFPCCMHAC